MYEYYEAVRNQLGMKDRDVALGTGIGQGVFSDWKKGRYTPKVDKLQAIADFLGVSLEQIMTGAPKESQSGRKYYFDDMTAEVAQELFENKEMRILFCAARDSKPDDLLMAAELLKRFKETNPNG